MSPLAAGVTFTVLIIVISILDIFFGDWGGPDGVLTGDDPPPFCR